VHRQGGERLGRGMAGPINLNYIPRAEARDALRTALLGALAEAGAGSGSLVSVAAAAPWTEDLVAEVVRELSPGAAIHSPGEDLTALMGGTFRQWGLVLTAGTGSRCAWVPPGGGAPVIGGAWGSLFGDEGSGYAIGRRALQAVTWDWDGRGPATALSRLVRERWELDEPKRLVHRVYGPPQGAWRSRIASMCPLVGEAARGGDEVARGLLSEAARDLARMVAAVARRAELALPVDVLVSGGVFGLGELILGPLASALAGEGQFGIVLPELPPAYGALLLAVAYGGDGGEFAAARRAARAHWARV
jgi:N-acetylglucosamine kinase-like BadF-type ATPase